MSAFDWVIVAVYVLFSLAVGLIASRRIRNMSHFLVAGRNVKFYLGVASLSGTEMGVISVMGMSELGFTHGFTAATLGLCFLVGVTFVGATGFVINGLRGCRVMTIPEFYGIRFNPRVRWLAGLVMSVAGVLNMGLFLKVSATFFVCISGLNAEAVHSLMAVLLVIVLTYTLLGGMVSVVLTDYFQYIVLVTGVLIATGFTIYVVSFQEMFDVVANQQNLAGFSPFATGGLTDAQFLGWPFILLNLLVFMAVPALWQPAASRALSATNPKVARHTTMVSGLTFLGRCSLPIIWGIAAMAYFAANPNEAQPGMTSLEAMPRFLAIILPVGVIGVFVAGMFAADMSTYNSYLLAWSGILTQDVIAPLFGDRLTEKQRLLTNRILIVFIGAFILWMGLLYTPPDSFVQYQQLTGTIYLSGAVACVVLGLYWKHANTAGALAATVVGMAFPIVNLYMRNHLEDLPRWLRSEITDQWMINGWYAGMAAFVLAFVSMIVGSMVTAPWIRPTVRVLEIVDLNNGPERVGQEVE